MHKLQKMSKKMGRGKLTASLLAVGFVFALGMAMPALAATKSVTLRVTGYAGTARLENFQALVKLSEGAYGFRYADSDGSNGSDLWFEDSSGTVIPHEIDTWNAGGESFVWVKIPTVLPSTDADFPTAITMHYGDAAAKRATSDKVWTGFAGVWHMNGTVVDGVAQSESDATGHGLDAVPTVNYGTGDLTAMVTASGIVGNGRVNQTADSYVQGLKVPDYSSHVTDASKFTISGWWSATALNDYPRFASAEGATHYWAVVGYKNDGGSINRWRKIQGVYSNGEAKNGGSITSPFAIDSFQSPNWVYLTVVWDGTTLTAYSNGAQKYQKTGMVAQTALDTGFMIGGNSAAANRNPAWRGSYDEVRMYDGAQLLDRVKADYDTMNAPNAFLSATIGSYTLTQDCDWTDFGEISFASDAVIDLNGHDLSIVGLGGAAMFTNGVDGTMSQLTVRFDAATVNSSTAIGGDIVLVKDGSGTFTSSIAQTYTGGTVVTNGTAQAAASTTAYDAALTPFGTGEITVASGATFTAQSTAAFTNAFILAGGTLKCEKSVNVMLKRLTADSALSLSSSATNVKPSLYGGTAGLVDLGGRTLTVSLPKSEDYLRLQSSFSDNGGKIVATAGNDNTYLTMFSEIWATNVDFTVGCRISQIGKLHVHDYTQTEARSNSRYGGVTEGLYVHGTFTPVNDYFYGCTMMDGSTIDLSSKSDTWSVLSSIPSGNAGSRWVKFSDGATVYVKIGSRELDENAAVIAWDAATRPANLASLRFVFADGAYAGRELAKRSSGAYPFSKGLIITIL